MRILLICTGNICRSPTAHGVMRRMLEEAGLHDRVEVDSAGTQDYHAGESPDRRAQLHAARRGYDLSGLKARKITEADFRTFDLILAMDRGHFQRLEESCPPDLRHKLRMFMDFAEGRTGEDVPDPYYGGSHGFEKVLEMVEGASRGLIEQLREDLRSRGY